jgi:hypothetical protein
MVTQCRPRSIVALLPVAKRAIVKKPSAWAMAPSRVVMKIVLASAGKLQAASGQRFGSDMARDADRWTERANCVLE